MDLIRSAARLVVFFSLSIGLLSTSVCRGYSRKCQTVGIRLQSDPAEAIPSLFRTETDCAKYCQTRLVGLKAKLLKADRMGIPMHVGKSCDRLSNYAIDECVLRTGFCLQSWETFALKVHSLQCGEVSEQGDQCSTTGRLCNKFRDGCVPSAISDKLGVICRCEYLLVLTKIRNTLGISFKYPKLKDGFNCNHAQICGRLNDYLNVGIDRWKCAQSEALHAFERCTEDDAPGTSRAPLICPCFYDFASPSQKKFSRIECVDWSESPGAVKLLHGRSPSPEAWVTSDGAAAEHFAEGVSPSGQGTSIWGQLHQAAEDIYPISAKRLSSSGEQRSVLNPFEERIFKADQAPEYAITAYQSRAKGQTLHLDRVLRVGTQDQSHIQLSAREGLSFRIRSPNVEYSTINRIDSSTELDSMAEPNRGIALDSLTLANDATPSVPRDTVSTDSGQIRPSQKPVFDPSGQSQADLRYKRKADQLAFDIGECLVSTSREPHMQFPSRFGIDDMVKLVKAADENAHEISRHVHVLEQDQSQSVFPICERSDTFVADTEFWAGLGTIEPDITTDLHGSIADDAKRGQEQEAKSTTDQGVGDYMFL